MTCITTGLDRTIRRALILMAASLVAVPLLATPAEAHDRRDRHRARQSHRHEQAHRPGHEVFRPHGKRHVAARPHRAVFRTPPRTIRGAKARRYRAYEHGRVYDRAHRHAHVVYDFPVRTPAGYVVRPYAYCDGHLLDGRVTLHRPRVHFEVRF